MSSASMPPQQMVWYLRIVNTARLPLFCRPSLAMRYDVFICFPSLTDIFHESHFHFNIRLRRLIRHVALCAPICEFREFDAPDCGAYLCWRNAVYDIDYARLRHDACDALMRAARFIRAQCRRDTARVCAARYRCSLILYARSIYSLRYRCFIDACSLFFSHFFCRWQRAQRATAITRTMRTPFSLILFHMSFRLPPIFAIAFFIDATLSPLCLITLDFRRHFLIFFISII